MSVIELRYAKFPKYGHIYLPAGWLKLLGMQPGSNAEISYKNKEIRIRRVPEYTTENVRHISHNNFILIPKEIQRFAKLHPSQTYRMFVDDERKEFIVQPEYD
ncbi:hypothetical protein [Virgibacillus doumboii]|uniref:hypothetical protein n=1 Tax=Virgibacillus doumboii TaxID=2697503 RepID=UPI0013DE9D62|nr:hypothetical protein [Virgibacillus doumboii]